MNQDHTIAFDDLFCRRVQHCLLCGRHQAWLTVDYVVVYGLVLLAAWCARCRAQDSQQGQLTALLERRYGARDPRGRYDAP